MELKRKSSSTNELCTTDRAKCSKIENDEGFKPSSFIEALVSDNITFITEELYSLKKYLTTKEHVLALLDDNNKCFHALIQYLISIYTEKLKRNNGDAHSSNFSLNDDDIYFLTKEIVSILANMCHLSVSACLKVRDKNCSLVGIYLYFLNKKEYLPVKSSILRLIGNLCELKETATMIALNSVLVDKVVNCLKDDQQKTNEQSLRIIRLLAKRSQLSKSVLRSNCCLFIAEYIVKHKNRIEIFRDRPEILQTISYLFKFHPCCVAKQFAECNDFVKICLDLIFEFPTGTDDKYISHWLELILRCVRCSSELRSALSEKSIDRVLECEKNNDKLTDIHCRFLCAFLEDSYFRLHLRYEQWHIGNGALNKILECLEPQSLPSKRIPRIKIQNLIVESLCSLHYDDSLEFVIKHPTFIPSVLNHVRCYLDQEAHKCLIEYVNPEQKHLFPTIIDQSITQNEDNKFWPLCKNFSHSAATSPTNKNVWSPAMSLSSNSNISSSPSPAPSFDCSLTFASSPSSFLLDDYLQMNDNCNRDTLSPMNANQSAPSEVEPDDPMVIDLEVTERKEGKDESSNLSYGNELCLMQKLVHNELRLIAHFSHKEERQSIFLINEEIINLLVRHISEAAEMDNRLARALRRLSCHQSGLPLLLEMDFQRIIISRLIRRDCLLKRYARPCVRCDVRRDFGRLLLSDHALLADSRMGEYVLLTSRIDFVQDRLSSQGHDTNMIYALMSALVLIRQHERRARFFLKFRPIDILFDVLRSLLHKCSQNEISLVEDSAEAKLCCDIVATFASIFPHQLFESSLSSKSLPQTVSIIDEPRKKCILLETTNSCDENSAEALTFRNSKGEHLVTVLKRDLCTCNEYFSGMFSSEFVEKLEYRDQFIFNPDEEACSQEDFIKFLHVSIGCPFGVDCTSVNDAQTCASLLYLADKYLCTRLLDFLLSGVATKFITGQSLPIFLPLVLAIPTLADKGGLKGICMLVLLQYSNNSELLYTLQHVAKCDSGSSRTKAIDELIEMLHKFISSLSQGITSP